MNGSSVPILIPAPKKMRYEGKQVLDSSRPVTVEVTVEAGSQPAAVTLTAVRQLTAWLEEHWGGTVKVRMQESQRDESVREGDAYRVRLVERGMEAERYTLVSDANELRITGVPQGLLYGVQTLLQLLQPGTTRDLLSLPLAEIEDEPDLAVRGIFAESFWGSDLMELDDWKAMVDEMVSFKLNTLGIGIYGCWPRRYPAEGNSSSEFLFAPLLDDPELVEERSIRYWNPATGQAETKTYRPALYEQDGLSKLIAYAVERGVRVIPQFNGPGHSRLLPRLYPAISSVDGQGQATGTGYSLTHPETFPMLKRMMKRVIDRYMKPFGQTWFHIGMDEITSWCAEDLKKHSPRQLLELYLTEIGRFLVDNGMEKIIIWHDMADSLTGFDEAFETLLERSDLAGKVVIHWWNYTMPVLPVRSVRGAAGWMAPSTGYLAGMFYQDYVENIENRLNEGAEHSFEGAMAYALYSPTFRRNTAFLAEKSWNTRKRSASEFERVYAGWIVDGQKAEQWARGFQEMRKMFQYNPTFVLLLEIGVFSGNGDASRPYPSRIIQGVLASDGIHKAYRITRALAQHTLLLFERGDPVSGREYDLLVNRFECRRVIGLIDALLGLADAVQAEQRLAGRPVTDRSRLAEIGGKLERHLDELDALLAEMQTVLPPYMAYVACREYMFLRQAMQVQADELALLARDEAIGSGEALIPRTCLVARPGDGRDGPLGAGVNR
ncbi:family 20 glycosylhydrolase [Paenibacillus sp. GYB004]|uniref:family 20 glycosylhydrolase n=1 Tax=Paenibacillus sp. GYB004 TaxID=2994393 RepID=UPI002F96D53F